MLYCCALITKHGALICMDKPFSQACENNKSPILKVLKEFFSDVTNVLEVGSGTGQHSVHFATHLAHLQWHCSDREVNHPGYYNGIKKLH